MGRQERGELIRLATLRMIYRQKCLLGVRKSSNHCIIIHHNTLYTLQRWMQMVWSTSTKITTTVRWLSVVYFLLYVQCSLQFELTSWRWWELYEYGTERVDVGGNVLTAHAAAERHISVIITSPIRISLSTIAFSERSLSGRSHQRQL